MAEEQEQLQAFFSETFDRMEESLSKHEPLLQVDEIGRVTRIGESVAFADGLPGVQSDELVRLRGDRYGMVFNLDRDRVGVVLLDPSDEIEAGSLVRRTRKRSSVPVGEEMLGRVVDANGRPRDGRGPLRASDTYAIERDAPDIMLRAPVKTPLQTGIKAVDALVPIGRGQRELILGDRQTGKSAIAIAAIVNQKNSGVRCVYCAIGQRASAVAQAIADLREQGAMEYTTVVATTGDDSPGLQYIAPYAATSIAEYFMHQGEDVLVVYDDLTRHARSYRELSLLLRRPPGREAYPGDIFYIHSRLLERSTHLREEEGGGSLTALPIVETQAQNISAYIPTNLISITDGQIYLSPRLFQQGVLPAVDVGKSVSRVGGKAQLPAYRTVAGDLKLSYAQFEELERFSRYGTRLEEEKRKTLARGRRVREVLKQGALELLSPGMQIAVFVAVTNGVLDGVSLDKVREAEEAIRQAAEEKNGDILKKIEAGEKPSDEDLDALRETAENAVKPSSDQEPNADD